MGRTPHHFFFTVHCVTPDVSDATPPLRVEMPSTRGSTIVIRGLMAIGRATADCTIVA